jgi:hypothetical protein
VGVLIVERLTGQETPQRLENRCRAQPSRALAVTRYLPGWGESVKVRPQEGLW